MKSSLRYLVPIFAVVALASCAPADVDVKMDHPVQIYKGGKTLDMTARDPRVLVPLGKEGTALLKQYIDAAQPRSVGYVLSNYYIKTDNRTIGVVDTDATGLIGLDITTNDASQVPATTTHTLLVGDDPELAAALLKQIKLAAK